MVGKVFKTNTGSDCRIVDYVDCMNVYVEFDGHYKHRQKTYLSTLKRGCLVNAFAPSVKGVGFIGVGEYVPSINGKHTKAYSMWKSMLTRCYCEKFQSKNKTYLGCTVDAEWHNFQNFAEWYYKNKFCGLGYDLDKDLLEGGNKVYSPSTCCLVPSEINLLLASNKTRRGKYPQGVSYDSFCNSYKATLSANGKYVNLGRYATPDHAYKVYKAAKEDYVKQRAIHWKGKVDHKVYEKLMNWKLDE